jgi:cell division protein ZapA
MVTKSLAMSEQATSNITVVIGGRPFPLKIKDGDEPIIRRIVKEVNDKIALFQNTYPRKENQDWLSMTLLTYAVDLHKAQAQPVASVETQTVIENIIQESELLERLSSIDDLLSQTVSR